VDIHKRRKRIYTPDCLVVWWVLQSNIHCTPAKSMSVFLTVGPKFAGHVACCHLVSHGEYADRTHRQTRPA